MQSILNAFQLFLFFYFFFFYSFCGFELSFLILIPFFCSASQLTIASSSTPHNNVACVCVFVSIQMGANFSILCVREMMFLFDAGINEDEG